MELLLLLWSFFIIVNCQCWFERLLLLFCGWVLMELPLLLQSFIIIVNCQCWFIYRFFVFSILVSPGGGHFTSIVRTGLCLIAVWTCKLAWIISVRSLRIRAVNLHVLCRQSLGSVIPTIGLGLSERIYTRTRGLGNRSWKAMWAWIYLPSTKSC